MFNSNALLINSFKIFCRSRVVIPQGVEYRRFVLPSSICRDCDIDWNCHHHSNIMVVLPGG